MRLKIYILVLVSLFAISCKKKKFITIQANNLVTGMGTDYSGMEFYIEATKYQFLTDNKYKILYKGKLNENGYASFEVKTKNNDILKWHNRLYVEKPQGILYSTYESKNINNIDKNYTFIIDYLSTGYTNIHYENVNCDESGTDEFRYTFYFTQDPKIYFYKLGGIIGDANNWGWNPLYYPAAGCDSYFGDKSIAVPEGNYTVEWQVSRPSGITTGMNTFTVYENDTTTYLIQY